MRTCRVQLHDRQSAERMHGGLFVSTGQIRGARLAERHGACEVDRRLAVMVAIAVGRRQL